MKNKAQLVCLAVTGAVVAEAPIAAHESCVLWRITAQCPPRDHVPEAPERERVVAMTSNASSSGASGGGRIGMAVEVDEALPLTTIRPSTAAALQQQINEWGAANA